MRLRVVSYNIHRCIGRDGRRDPDRIRRIIREVDAHVVALQEVELLDEAPDFLEFLCHDTGLSPIPGMTMRLGQAHYGNALLTALPVVDVEFVDLSFARREPRAAIHATLAWAGNPVQIIATHLGLRARERRSQMRRLLALLSDNSASTPPEVSILMGDLNEWFLWGRPLRWLRAQFDQSPAPATFPSGRPLFALDRIWVRPREKLLSIQAVKSELTNVASDHLPLIAQVRKGS
ncbi:MAG: endonuclease/exonuclease/phosphatase family protein [Gammaproteobacteria bacterium]|nr:endonuclease/exonuclease/phosphatase family protein [Gammaproteobacteria bacterium]